MNINFGSSLGCGRRGGGCAPHAPLLSRGLCSLDPPKGAPRPWLQRVFAFSRPSHLSGGELFLRIPTFFEETACPKQLRCLGQNFFSEMRLVCEQTTCPGQLRCLEQNSFSKSDFFFEQATCPGQRRCLGQNFFSRTDLFSNQQLVLGSFAAWGRTVSQKSDFS